MKFLRYLSGSIFLLWLLGIVFRFGGKIINTLLIVSIIVFIFDTFRTKKYT